MAFTTSLLHLYHFIVEGRGGSKKFRGGGGGTSVLREGVQVIDGRCRPPSLGGSGGMLPQKIFRFISSEIASGVILNMFALFVTLLFWYSRSRRGASARSLRNACGSRVQ